MKTTRIYGKVTKLHDDYYEVEYEEYTDDIPTGAGTEDFINERLRDQTKKFDVYCYNGKTMKGAYRDGYRMTDCVGTMRISKNSSKITAARIKYGAENVARVGR